MSESSVDFPLRVFLFATGSVAFFAVMNVFVKLAAEEASTAQIIFFRSFFALLPLLIMMRKMGGFSLLKTQKHFGHFWRGIVGLAAMACFFISFAMLPLANATAIHFAAPLILTVLAIPLLKEKVGLPRWSAVIVGLCGVMIMLSPSSSHADIGDSAYFTGSLIAFAAAFLSALAMIFVRKLGATEHALTIVFYFSLYGTLGGLIAMFFYWQPLSLYSLSLLIATGVLGGVAQILLTYSYTLGPASYVAPFSYLAMVFAIGADILVWGIWPAWHIYPGSAIIMGSGLFILYREMRKKRKPIVRPNLYSLQPVMPTHASDPEKRRRFTKAKI